MPRGWRVTRTECDGAMRMVFGGTVGVESEKQWINYKQKEQQGFDKRSFF